MATTEGVPAVADLRDPGLYTNRELSWLDFNARVLALAGDGRVPLLERCKFLAIFSSNLDEFFMVRVAAAQEALEQRRPPSTPDQMPRDEVLTRVARRVQELVAEQYAIWSEGVRPALAEAGIPVCGMDELDPGARREVDDRFDRQVLPVLTPLAVGPGLPFPYISGLSLNLALRVRNPETDETRFARVKVPPGLPRLFAAEGALVPLEEVIAVHVGRLFPGMEIRSSLQFRVTRDADFSISDDVDDLVGAVEDQLRQRRFGHAVRLEVRTGAPADLVDEVTAALGVEARDIYEVPGVLDLTCLFALTDLDRPELKDAPWRPVTPARLQPDPDEPTDMFAVLRAGDVLVHHPYDDFTTSVERFVVQAVDDPDVLAIKQTVYRTSGDSPIVPALVRAAERGVQTVCLVEVKARFDEENNIRWARDLERAGVHVVYGIPGLKTHAKLCLVVRREGQYVRRYCHIGTGNYNPKTARLYTDAGLFTCRPDVTEDVANLFNHLTGFGRLPEYRRLLVAPDHARDGLVAEIERVAAAHRRGVPGRVVMKANALIDGPVIRALYEASTAGVPVDLVVRSIVGLRPGVPGVSENIRVVSIVGRFLEHARVFWLQSGDDRRVWLGSADIMVRNLDHRVEVVTPVDDPAAQDELVAALELMLADNVLAWELGPDGTWARVTPAPGQDELDSQLALMARARARA
ncbi:MAG TPA: polyphosphate kinase 1 [Miltoncostaeaceae bacterium]|nr:polyphosphate kinase 1 [Miltoncostaeaceae bacterium]